MFLIITGCVFTKEPCRNQGGCWVWPEALQFLCDRKYLTEKTKWGWRSNGCCLRRQKSPNNFLKSISWELIVFTHIYIHQNLEYTFKIHIPLSAAAAAASLQSCPTLCDAIDSSPPGSPVPGILQARTLEWVAISFSNAWKWKVKAKLLSRVWLLATPWTAAYQAPPSMGFSRQE